MLYCVMTKLAVANWDAGVVFHQTGRNERNR